MTSAAEYMARLTRRFVACHICRGIGRVRAAETSGRAEIAVREIACPRCRGAGQLDASQIADEDREAS